MKAIAAESQALAKLYQRTFDLDDTWRAFGAGQNLSGWRFERVVVVEWAAVRKADLDWLERLTTHHVAPGGQVVAL